jgi:hypothetical protein
MIWEKKLLYVGGALMLIVPPAIIAFNKSKNRRMNDPILEDLKRIKAKGR